MIIPTDKTRERRVVFAGIKGVALFTVSGILLTLFLSGPLARGENGISNYSGESIQYLIKPAGKLEYMNLGLVDLNGVKANLLTLKTRVLFVQVTEKIYSDPETLLPYKTERTTSGFFSREYRTEEYDQKNFTVSIRKYKGSELLKEKVIQGDGPIHNVNLLLFYLRMQPNLQIGWHVKTKVPDELNLLELDLTLLSVQEIKVPAGKFRAYYFKSVPDKYEIWIDQSGQRIPLMITVKGVLNCSILMKGFKA